MSIRLSGVFRGRFMLHSSRASLGGPIVWIPLIRIEREGAMGLLGLSRAARIGAPCSVSRSVRHV